MQTIRTNELTTPPTQWKSNQKRYAPLLVVIFSASFRLPFLGHQIIKPEIIISNSEMVEIPIINLPLFAPKAPSAFDFPKSLLWAELAILKIFALFYCPRTSPVYWSTQRAAIAGFASITLYACSESGYVVTPTILLLPER